MSINLKQESTGIFEDLKSPATSVDLQADILTYRGTVSPEAAFRLATARMLQFSSRHGIDPI